MLGKLLKYDMKYMARILPWVYLGGLGISLLCSAAMLFIPSNMYLVTVIIYSLIPSFCIMAVYAVVVLTVVFYIIRVYRSLYSDEGYLTFTLPVKNGTIIDSKILAGAIWLTVSLLVSYLIIKMPDFASQLRSASEAVPEGGIEITPAHSELSNILTKILFWLNMVTAVFFIPSLYAFCSAVTHKAKRARAFASIGMFMGIVYGLFITFTVAFLFLTISTYDYGYYDTPAPANMGAALLPSYGVPASVDYLPVILLSILWVVLSAMTAVSWIVARKVVNKKLNLQ